MKLFKYIGVSGILAATVFGSVACKKSYLDTKPSNQTTPDVVFQTVKGAKAVINGMHRSLYSEADHDKFGMASIALQSDLMTEDLGHSKQGAGWFTTASNYSDARDGDSYTWGLYYNIINNANFILANIDAAEGDEMDRNEVKGQALAYRAWAYLQLIQTYQFAYKSPQYVVAGSTRLGVIQQGATTSEALGVPIYLVPGKVGNPRASMQQVLDRINIDIDSSIYWFDQGVNERTDKSQINVNVAHGIAARNYLYQQQWTKAQDHANKARQGYYFASHRDLLRGFNNISSDEWVWGSVINFEHNGVYASWASHMDARLGGYASMDPKLAGRQLLRSGTVTGFQGIPTTDVRKNWFVAVSGSVPPGSVRASQKKFYSQSPTNFISDFPLMRLPELYLIEAEAIAQGAGTLTAAKNLLKEFVATRDDIQAYDTVTFDTLNTKNQVVQEIWRQFRIELWGEGHRFFNAKRQMAQFVGVTSLTQMNRAIQGFYGLSINGYETINAGAAALNFRIPGGELNQTPSMIQNP